jgi:hypothetical protein
VQVSVEVDWIFGWAAEQRAFASCLSHAAGLLLACLYARQSLQYCQPAWIDKQVTGTTHSLLKREIVQFVGFALPLHRPRVNKQVNFIKFSFLADDCVTVSLSDTVMNEAGEELEGCC